MITQPQSHKSRKLLIGAVLVVAAIAVAAVIFDRVQTSGPTGTAGRDGGSSSDAMIGGLTAGDSATTARHPKEQADAGVPEDSSGGAGESGTAGGQETEAGEAAARNQSGVDSVSGRERQTSLPGGSAAVASADVKPEDTAGGGVPRAGVEGTDGAGDTVVADAEAGDTESGDTESGDTESDDPEEEEDASAPLEGFWTGRVEAGVPTSQDGKWSCAGAGVSVLRLMYSDRSEGYRLTGQAQLDNGFLNANNNREMRRAITFTGRVDGGGVVSHFKSWRLPNRWNFGLPDYQLNLQGQFSISEGKGTWQDTVGCSGTWSLTRLDVEIR